MTNPTADYIGTLKPSGQRGMLHALDIVAGHMTGGRQDAQTMAWQSVTPWHAVQIANRLGVDHSHAYAVKIMAALRGVMRTAQAAGLISSENCKAVCAVKVPRNAAPQAKTGRVLTAEEVAAMFVVLDANENRVTVRDAAMLELMLTTGIKRGAVVALPHDAEVPETDRLKKWRELRGGEPGPLFPKVHDVTKPLTDQCVLLMVRKAGRMAGVGAVTAQDVKRTWKAGVK